MKKSICIIAVVLCCCLIVIAIWSTRDQNTKGANVQTVKPTPTLPTVSQSELEQLQKEYSLTSYKKYTDIIEVTITALKIKTLFTESFFNWHPTQFIV